MRAEQCLCRGAGIAVGTDGGTVSIYRPGGEHMRGLGPAQKRSDFSSRRVAVTLCSKPLFLPTSDAPCRQEVNLQRRLSSPETPL